MNRTKPDTHVYYGRDPRYSRSRWQHAAAVNHVEISDAPEFRNQCMLMSHHVVRNYLDQDQ